MAKRRLTLNQIIKSKKVTHCYIYKRGYYRPNHCGYTDRPSRAGVYSKEEAVECALKCSELTLIPIDIVEHNRMIAKEIKELSTRFI